MSYLIENEISMVGQVVGTHLLKVTTRGRGGGIRIHRVRFSYTNTFSWGTLLHLRVPRKLSVEQKCFIEHNLRIFWYLLYKLYLLQNFLPQFNIRWDIDLDTPPPQTTYCPRCELQYLKSGFSPSERFPLPLQLKIRVKTSRFDQNRVRQPRKCRLWSFQFRNWNFLRCYQ